MNEYLLPVVLGLVALVAIIALGIRYARPNRVAEKVDADGGRTAKITKNPELQLEKMRASGRYTGILIQSGCQFSSYLAGRRFPIGDAPRLPLAGREAETCTCIYVGLPDRRVSERRAGVDRRLAIRLGLDRRAQIDRRRGASKWDNQYTL